MSNRTRPRGRSALLAIAAAALGVSSMAGSAAASIPDQEGTVTRSATATWTVGDPRNTTVTITPTVVSTSAGGTVTTTRTLDVHLIQDYCNTAGGYDIWTYVDLSDTVTNTKYIEAFENGYQKAKGKVPVTLEGTITYTPMGHNGTCAVATGPSQTDTFSATGKVDSQWEKDSSSSPVTALSDTDADTIDDTFTWTRDATAKGRIESRALALKHYLLEEDAATASLSLVAHATDGSDPSTMFTIKP